MACSHLLCMDKLIEGELRLDGLKLQSKSQSQNKIMYSKYETCNCGYVDLVLGVSYTHANHTKML